MTERDPRRSLAHHPGEIDPTKCSTDTPRRLTLAECGVRMTREGEIVSLRAQPQCPICSCFIKRGASECKRCGSHFQVDA